MFCLYCGMPLPDGALFCNRCGKQQQSPTNTSVPGAVMLPNLPLPNVPLIAGQPSPSNVPMVQGTSQVQGVPSVQGTPSAPMHAPAGNMASSPFSSPGSPSMPSQAPSSASPVHPAPIHERHIEPTYRKQYTPHKQHRRIERPDAEPESSPAEKRHEQSGMQHSGRNVAGHLSRRAVILGLAGATVVVATGGGIVWWTLTRNQHLLFIYRGHTASVLKLAWSPNGKRIASGGYDDTVQIWNVSDGGGVLKLQGDTYDQLASYINAVGWSPDGKSIAFANGEEYGTVQVRNATDGQVMYSFQGHKYGVAAMAWSPDGTRIASAGAYVSGVGGTLDDRAVQVWNAADGGNVFLYLGHARGAGTLAWSPDSKRIASAGDDVQVWNATDGGNVLMYRGHADYVTALAWSPDGRYIVSGGWTKDRTVQVWSAIDGRNIFTYHGHSDGIRSVAWSPDSKRIASASLDKTVQVWDATTGGNSFTYSGHSEQLNAVAWSPDGTRIASAAGGYTTQDNDSTVQVWQPS